MSSALARSWLSELKDGQLQIVDQAIRLLTLLRVDIAIVHRYAPDDAVVRLAYVCESLREHIRGQLSYAEFTDQWAAVLRCATFFRGKRDVPELAKTSQVHRAPVVKYCHCGVRPLQIRVHAHVDNRGARIPTIRNQFLERFLWRRIKLLTKVFQETCAKRDRYARYLACLRYPASRASSLLLFLFFIVHPSCSC